MINNSNKSLTLGKNSQNTINRISGSNLDIIRKYSNGNTNITNDQENPLNISLKKDSKFKISSNHNSNNNSKSELPEITSILPKDVRPTKNVPTMIRFRS